MRKALAVGLLAISLATSARVGSLEAATNLYVQFEGPAVTGDRTSSRPGEIEILSWNHGSSQPTSPTRGTTGGGTVERADHQTLTFTKYLDSATDDLLKRCWSGQPFAKVTLTAYRADGLTGDKPVMYLKIEMEHVVISNCSISGGAGDVPVETVALDYGSIKYSYIPKKGADGTGGAAESVQYNLETRKIE